MKVALCFSGLPRFLRETHPYWKCCLLDQYNIDVFVHTWDTSKITTDTIQSLYRPMVLKTEKPQLWDTSAYTDRIWPHRTTPNTQISQYEGIRRVLDLRKNYEKSQSFKYDIVIRARFDWYLESVDLEKNNCINVAHTPTLNGHRFLFEGKEHIGISDQFAYGSSENMTIYSQLVDNLPILYKNYKIDFCGELFLKSHLLCHKIDIKEHKWNNGIVRDWGVMP